MKIKNIFLSLSLVILLGASALAQTGNDVTVKLINKDGKVVATSNLDSKGNFSFPDLAPGDYTMKVNVQDFHFMHDKGTNGQNSTGRGINNPGLKKNEEVAIAENSRQKTGEIKGSVTQKIDAVDRVAGNSGSSADGKASDMHLKIDKVDSATANNIFIKFDGISGLASSDFYMKFKGDMVAQERATSGLKDTLKTQVRTAQPSEVQVDSWSWGASNSLSYKASNEQQLKDGVEIKISVKEKKNIAGHVTLTK
jgi:hypothetical protein